MLHHKYYFYRGIGRILDRTLEIVSGDMKDMEWTERKTWRKWSRKLLRFAHRRGRLSIDRIKLICPE